MENENAVQHTERILAQLTFSGQHDLSHDRLEQLFIRLQAQIKAVNPIPPCNGGRWITWQAGWERVGDKTCFVDRITWVCPPDDHLVVVVTVQCD